MANMGYCRFINTLEALLDCEDHMDDELSVEEAKAREKLIETCQMISNDYSDLLEE